MRELKEHIKKNYIPKEKMDVTNEDHENRIKETEKELGTIKEVIGLLKVNIRKDITDSVKRVMMNQPKRKSEGLGLKKR